MGAPKAPGDECLVSTSVSSKVTRALWHRVVEDGGVEGRLEVEGQQHRVMSDCHFAGQLNHFMPGSVP